MGEAGAYTEHLLILLPLPLPGAIIDDLRKSFPHIEVTYKEVSLTDKYESVPKGKRQPRWPYLETIRKSN
jgi:hypothetical protein